MGVAKGAGCTPPCIRLDPHSKAFFFVGNRGRTKSNQVILNSCVYDYVQCNPTEYSALLQHYSRACYNMSIFIPVPLICADNVVTNPLQ